MPPIPFIQNVDISHLNTMAVPCVAEYFIEVTTEAALTHAIKSAKKHNLAIFILGGGSNVLCQPFIKGVVIVPAIKGIEVSTRTNTSEVFITASAGENWHALVQWCLTQGYFGLENLALIPGNVGAAPIQNIGAYGVELADVLVSVKWFDCESFCFNTLSSAQCELAYRDSIFKNALKNNAVITQITLRLNTQPNPVIHYKPLADYFLTIEPTPQLVFDEVCKQRNSKLPNPKHIPNSGSFFKNPIISAADFEHLKTITNNQALGPVPFYLQSCGAVKIPAAWLIDKAGLKGAQVKGLQIHTKQALVLTNPNAMPLKAVLQASDEITHIVKQRFNVILEREPQILG